MKRSQAEVIKKDLQKKMVFIVGPRQVGKTWLAKEIAKDYKNPLYLNYDDITHKKVIENKAWIDDVDLIIFDEIHKMPKWKNYIKGVFDTKPEHLHILVTGSARLNAHRQAGDSLAGRFILHRLLPFSLAELLGSEYESVDLLLKRSGFPEPLFAESETDASRWHNLYIDSLIRGDVLDFADVNDWLAMKQVFEILKYKVGSPLSYSNIAQDVGISPNTVKRYISIFEALIVRPYSKKISRAISKRPKIYFYDYAFVPDQAARLENLVALELLKHLFILQDQKAINKSLHYLRDKEGREVDFVISNEAGELEKLIEVKTSGNVLNKPLKYFSEKYSVPAFQLVLNLQTEQKLTDSIELRKPSGFLKDLK